MATKKTESTKAKAPPKKAAAKAPAKAKAAPKAPVKVGPRHPRAKLIAAHGSKEALAKTLAALLAHGEEDTDAVEARLRTASNQQLLRLASVTATVKKKWGSRDKLIAAIGTAQKKSKDKDYLAKLEAMPLPRLVELAGRA
jgi:hypothetical protein